MKTAIKTDNGTAIVNISSLSQLLQIGQEPELDPYQPEFYAGYFDEQNNYHFDDIFLEDDVDVLFPWEWVLHPEIIELAKQFDVKVPADPPFDISKTF